MLSEMCDTIPIVPMAPKEKFKHFTKVPSHISLIEYEEDYDEEFLTEIKKEKVIENNGSFISDDRCEDSFDEREFETEPESGSLREK